MPILETIEFALLIWIVCSFATQPKHRRIQVVTGLIVTALVAYQSLYVDGPFELFEAPFGIIQRARRVVAAVHGDMGEIVRGRNYEIRLHGKHITDDVLQSLAPEVETFTVLMFLEDTAVTCAGAKRFQAIPRHCSVVTDIEGCREIVYLSGPKSTSMPDAGFNFLPAHGRPIHK